MRFGLLYEIGMPKPWYEGQEAEKYWQLMAQIEDQGTVWGSEGLGQARDRPLWCECRAANTAESGLLVAGRVSGRPTS